MKPERVQHFRILDKIGEGGMGEVFLAFDEALERRVALKAIHRSRVLARHALERFQHEARTLSALDHPGICRIYEYLETPQGDYLVLELVEGWSLRDILATRQPRARALALAEQLAEVLSVAHKAGVIHRDLKPGNVMVTPGDHIKVLDFGLSRREGLPDHELTPAEREQLSTAMAPGAASEVHEPAEPHLPPRTDPGTVLGTLQYMSPEQARGLPVTAATDLFALGLILQELFTGQPGHPRGLGLVELIARVAAGRVDLSPDLGRDLGPLVRELTRIEPEARPRADQVLQRLRWIRGRRRRVARRAIVAGLLLTGSLAWLKYTIDLRRRERQAVDVIEYLVGDLREQLVPLGRLDILADVGRRALRYFDAVPRRQWTDEELTRRCQAYHQIGDVLSRQGDRDGALEFFKPALESADELVRRDPTHQDWVFQRGQLEFYMGQVPYERGDYEDARPYFAAYLETAKTLLELAPGRPEYQVELAYAKTNLGALALEEKHWQEAVGFFQEVCTLWRGLVQQEPDDPQRRCELADALSWLAQGFEEPGKLARVIGILREENALREELHSSDPDNLNWEYLRSVCGHHLAQSLEAAGQLQEARDEFDRAVQLARELVRHDGSNADWRRHLGVALTNQTRLLLRSQLPQEADVTSVEAREVLERLARLDPSNDEWRTLSVTARLICCEVQHALGSPVEALEGSEPILEDLAAHELGVELEAETRILRGRALRDLDEDEPARAEFEQALVALEGVASESRSLPQEELRAQALVLLQRHDEASELLDRLEASGLHAPELREQLRPVVGVQPASPR